MKPRFPLYFPVLIVGVLLCSLLLGGCGNVYCGTTPLMGAIQEKPYVAVVQVLLDAGADVDSRDYEDNESALHRVAFYGHSAIAKMLLDHGADVNARNNQGDTPLRIAMDSERGEMASLLKRHGGKK